ncbi:pyridoxamine 5'-phosphate oxidase family protein [Micromonospora sagamiensis]|uniref:Pyridoxamine 5'-phosphate oxidase n=1 Tax=Micromonospora sagamiensis TaxID=47875 RepID=A0A562WLF7_9ACTN|nr:pyridoxamine 5'-phosphate oxidase family protein [Micromonospora sagamiensis]TWJ31026.1 pyridoxamine 5'-phosphate oxidase [Micromonospora sagamiensis]BCL15932.1 pyridoxamine 5'-phosphate oxidase [Micromonospora sagamiensis]
MAWWSDLVDEEPDFAERVRARFAVRKHGTMATLRRDGSPRISGTEFQFEDGDLRVGSMPGALKALDLRRDPRLALHCPTEDTPEDDPGSWDGDAKIAGIAHELPPPEDGSHRFRVELTEVVLTRVGEPADHLVIESWHPGRGLHRRIRR